MAELEHDFATSANEASSLQLLREQIHSLQMILAAALMALLLLSAAVNIYLFRQVSMVRKELDGATRIVRDYETNRKPLVNSFVSNLVVYARSHQDFNAILQKYGLPPSPPSQVAQSNSTPAAAQNK